MLNDNTIESAITNQTDSSVQIKTCDISKDSTTLGKATNKSFTDGADIKK